jgi:hypothetical protein
MAAASFTSKLGTAVAVTVGIAIAAGVGYELHKATKKRNEQRALVSVVGDTTSQLRSFLKTHEPDALTKIEGNLRVAKTWSNPLLADAIEQYLVGAREIMRRRAEADRLAQKAAASRATLTAHINRASRRDPHWIRNAQDLKRQVERDHFELDVQLKALADLLDRLPEANKYLEPYVQASLILDDAAREDARRAVLREAKLASAELAKTRALILPR